MKHWERVNLVVILDSPRDELFESTMETSPACKSCHGPEATTNNETKESEYRN